MAHLGMSTIVTIASISTRGNGTTAYFPSRLPFVTNVLAGGDCVKRLLTAAQQHGLTVHLGLELNYDFDLAETYATNASAVGLFSVAASHNAALTNELHERYASKFPKTLVGVYDSNEINDVEWSKWREARFYGLWVQHYLRPTHTLPSQFGLQSSNAPYFCHSGTVASWNPASVATFYRQLLQDVPGLQRLWVQDCIGVSTGRLSARSPGTWFASPTEVAPFYSALSKMAASLQPAELYMQYSQAVHSNV